MDLNTLPYFQTEKKRWDEDCEYRGECPDAGTDECRNCPCVYFGLQPEECMDGWRE